MSARNLDKQGRFRSKTVAFRVSPEEWKQFEIAVKLSGLTKQEYLINRIAERNIVVQGNPRVYKALRNQLIDVLVSLKRINELGGKLIQKTQIKLKYYHTEKDIITRKRSLLLWKNIN